jgi:hypothetical protein
MNGIDAKTNHSTRACFPIKSIVQKLKGLSEFKVTKIKNSKNESIVRWLM